MIRKYSNIDDIFRDKLRDFELYPPDHIWENIKQQIETGKGKNTSKTILKGGIIGFTIFIVLFTLLIFYVFEDNADKTESFNQISTSRTIDRSVPRSGSVNSKDDHKISEFSKKSDLSGLKSGNSRKIRFDLNTDESTEKGKTNLAVTFSESGNKDLPATKDNEFASPTLAENVITQQQVLPDNIIEKDHSGTMGPAALNDIPAVNPVEHFNEPEIPAEEDDFVMAANMALSSAPELQSDYGKKGNLSFGLFFTPDIIHYPSVSEFNTRSYNLDLNVIYEFSGYMVQTGPGISWTSDQGDYKVDYNQYLGSYNDVYNITFDTTGGQYIPIYHTENVNVYDTIDHISVTPTKRKYTYLNVPLLFGYGMEGRRLGWFVKTGPNLSLLIHKNNPEVNLSDTQNKILSVESEIPSRLQTNWQFVLSAGASYKLSNSLSFTLEPLFKYYINSTHEQTGFTSKDPYSFGLRAGFVLGF